MARERETIAEREREAERGLMIVKRRERQRRRGGLAVGEIEGEAFFVTLP